MWANHFLSLEQLFLSKTVNNVYPFLQFSVMLRYVKYY